MSELTIWKAGVKIYPVEKPKEIAPEPSEAPGEHFEKLGNCIHASETEITRHKRTCCSTITQVGYECNKLRIYPLTAAYCNACPLFSRRV